MNDLAYAYVDERAFRQTMIEFDAPRYVVDVIMSVVELVDRRTGESHPRYPITLARIAQEARYSVSRVCDAMNAAGQWIKRFVMPPRRQKGGMFRQLPTDYKLLVPEHCWRKVYRASSTVAARPVEPKTIEISWTCTVQGKLSTQDAATKRRPHVPRSWNLDPSQPTTFIDDMHYDKLAPKLLEAAQFAAEGVDESLRHRTMVCLNALRERAHDVALLACNLNLSSWDSVNCVRHWVARCVTNPRQRVDSAEHAINILRRFFLVQQEWAEHKGAERIRERTRAKYQRLDEERVSREEQAEREQRREAWAHIAVGHDKLDASVLERDIDCPW